MMNRIIRNIYFTMLLCIGLSPSANAGLMFAGDLAGGTGVLRVTSDISFTVEESGDLDLFVFQGWSASLGIADSVISNPLNAPVSLLVNGAADTVFFNFLSFSGYSNNDITFADAWFRGLAGPTVSPGDVVTLLAQDIGVSATTIFSPLTQFAGSAFGSTEFGQRLTGLTTITAVGQVPLPGTVSLIVLALFGIRAGRAGRVS
jgi:hypothetical protein